MSTSNQYHSLLSLKRFLEVQNTRLALLSEFETALESHLSISSTQEDQDPNQLQPTQLLHQSSTSDPQHEPISDCRRTHTDLSENSDEYLQQVITISTSGLMEIKSEVELLITLLKVDLQQPQLGKILEDLQTLESQKLNESLQRNLLQRRARLEQRDYSEEIQAHDQKIQALMTSIQQTMEEVRAEIAELDCQVSSGN